MDLRDHHRVRGGGGSRLLVPLRGLDRYVRAGEGEIADGAGELGFFPPYSWWPLWCALALGVMVYGVAMSAWWLVIIGFTTGAVVTCGFVFEYYRGEHAH